MSRLADCDECGALSCLDSVRPVYDDGGLAPNHSSAQTIGVEQDIQCPACGQRTQIILDADCPA